MNVDWSNLNNYQVGVHQNCPITLKRSHNGFSLTTKDQITHQVYCSALNFQKNVITNRFTQALAENILMAEYRATILAAWDNSEKFPIYKGSKKCFLTLLGGGVFRNPFEIICRAISSCKDIIEGSGLDVYVVCFDDFCFNKTYPYLNKTIRETGGSIIEA
ncbi:hypothetical protein TRFO_12141 [Tritrichomonas foetus]|uniref:Macro domain-containing protein n=1 Tax=Tritrichomonas foetus TaxID=1144522 RepID=A0A1J4J675_9EUKA|nr:hypothetical protein TRFO_12141 [Tritrichomonas foetus]|eukprot:OHS92957.1 hypothetical protein TRFO_12141 [Tritrichomonas foetus]